MNESPICKICGERLVEVVWSVFGSDWWCPNKECKEYMRNVNPNDEMDGRQGDM